MSMARWLLDSLYAAKEKTAKKITPTFSPNNSNIFYFVALQTKVARISTSLQVEVDSKKSTSLQVESK